MAEKYIPVVMSADEHYSIPLIVAVTSMVCNANKGTKYQLYILVTQDFSDIRKEQVNNILKKYDMPSAKYICMNEKYSDASVQVEHLTIAAYYRLEIPELLKNEKRCIYLDDDVIVNKDLSELYNVELEDYYIAGVKAAAYYHPEKNVKRMEELLNIPEFNQYVNSGVLVMNLEMLRRDKMIDRFKSLVPMKFPNNDQDILNCACYGKIKLLYPKYNSMTKYHLKKDDAYETIPCISKCFSKEEWEAACKEPVIIHYADKWKPWENLAVDFAEEWWENADTANITWEAFSYFQTSMFVKQKKEKMMHQECLEQERAKLERANVEKSNLNERLQKVNSEKSKLNEALQKLNSEKNDLNETLQKITEEKNDLDRRLDFIQKEKLALNSELQQVYQEKRMLSEKMKKAYSEKIKVANMKIQQIYAEKSNINAKLQQTYKEKSEINAKLQQTYKEKSEINAKLQQTYKEKFERGLQIKELQQKIDKQSKEANKNLCVKISKKMKNISKKWTS